MAVGSFRLPIMTPPVTEGDYLVRFIDFDGTVLKEQWVDSGDPATAPTPPTHTYLTFNDWNRDFSAVTADMDVGAMYDTTDGKTYLWMTFTAVSGKAPTLYLTKADTTTLTVDWGDSTTSSSSDSGEISLSRTYAAYGSYMITISCAAEYTFGYDSAKCILGGGADPYYILCLTKLYIGANVVELFAFSLTLGQVGAIAATALMIPDNVASIGVGVCTAWISTAGLVIPDSVTSIGEVAFGYWYSATSLVIPDGVTSIGASAFIEWYSATSLVIPDSVTSIGDGAFGSWYSATSLVIPDSVTSIGDGAFGSWFANTSFVIPDSVTSIGDGAFGNILGAIDIQVLPTTPPTLGIDVFPLFNYIMKIYVPDASVTAYKAATNWIDYADYIYALSDRP